MIQGRCVGVYAARFFALIVLHLLEYVCKDGKRGNGTVAGEPGEEKMMLALVGEAEEVKLAVECGEATVHGSNILDILRGPETLRDGGIARPDLHVDAGGGGVLDPHAGFAAEDARFLLVVERGGLLFERVAGVVKGGGMH